MNFKDLNYLLAVADTHHFGKAAERCKISQPTLSIQLKKLESELGITLFERSNRRIILTPIGARIVEQARRVMLEGKQLLDIAAQAQDPLSGDIDLGLPSTLGPYLLPHAIPNLRTALPKVHFNISEQHTSALLMQLEHGALDAVICPQPPQTSIPSNVVSTKLFAEFFKAILPSRHSLCNSETLKLSDLKGQQILLPDPTSCLYAETLDLCRKAHAQATQPHPVNSLGTLCNQVELENGIALLPAMAADGLMQMASQHSRKRLQKRAFTKPAPRRQIIMLWRKHSAKLKMLKTIASCLKA